ncbi:MAG: hypothetical protein JSU65_06200 [Candidatus Zixiibacteriota bacterium]|nr:MAG: hypothetical protein JSU65_06200 [candidate division Zixibacteria bacterium]
MGKQVSTLRKTAILVFSLLMISTAVAQDTLLISYQGRLTDDGGGPVTGTPPVTFAIYAESTGAGPALWQESYPSVEVSDGLFNVILGSQAALPDTVFNGEDRYLGITVGGDPEILPRTILTSAPGAAYAQKMVGDIATNSGSLVMRSSEGVDSAIVLTADDLASRIKIGMSTPPDDIRPGLETGADEFSNYLKVNWLFSAGPYEPAFEVSSHETEGIKMKLGVPPDDIKPSFEVSSDAVGEKVKMKLTVPPDDIKPVFEVEADAATERVSMVLGYPPDPYAPDAPAFEFSTSTTDGAGMNIYDEIGQVMGFDPSPFNGGYSITLYDPTQAAETPLISLGTDYSFGSSEASFRMYSLQAGDPAIPEIEMVSSEDLNRFTFGLSMPPDDIKPGMELTSNSTTATMMMGGGPGVSLDQQFITLTTSQSSAQIGIGTDTPTEALDVRGTAKVEGFKMPTGASDGHVLTSDADGNGTWQAPSSESSKAMCADMYEGLTNASSQVTITFPITFTAAPYFTVSGLIKSGAQAGQMAHIPKPTPGSSNVTVTIQYWDGGAFDNVGNSVEVMLSYTAMEK